MLLMLLRHDFSGLLELCVLILCCLPVCLFNIRQKKKRRMILLGCSSGTCSYICFKVSACGCVCVCVSNRYWLQLSVEYSSLRTSLQPQKYKQNSEDLTNEVKSNHQLEILPDPYEFIYIYIYTNVFPVFHI